MVENTTGLYGKYIIQKADGSPVNPKAQYFILRLDTDRWARLAVLYYATLIGEDNPQFARELREWVDRLSEAADVVTDLRDDSEEWPDEEAVEAFCDCGNEAIDTCTLCGFPMCPVCFEMQGGICDHHT